MVGFVAGRLLVASPALVDPNFARTVVYIGMHDVDGAFGLVLNRPLEIAVSDAVEGWDRVVTEPAVLFKGGPVDTSSVVGLARPLDATVAGWTPMAAGAGILDLRQPATDVVPGVASLRMFLGYAGWIAGQLEEEIASEAWFVVDVEREDLFTREPGRLWHRVLRRQPGKLAIFAFFPEDPTRN